MDTAAAHAAPAAPTAPGERVLELDVVRGFALFGILLVNMMMYAWPIYGEAMTVAPWTTPADRVSAWLIELLAEGKFYPLFSLLFGIGLGLQMRRMEARGRRPVPFLLRRMAVLLLIGLAHALLFWVGDVLVYYAVLGAVTLLFRNLSLRRLIPWVAVFLLVPIVIHTGLYGLIQLARMEPEGAAQVNEILASTAAQYAADYDRALQMYREGTFAEMTAQRVRDYSFATMGTLLNGMIMSILTMFLLGFGVERSGLLRRLPESRLLLGRVFRWGVGLGVPLSLTFALLGPVADPVGMNWGALGRTIAYVLGGPALCLGYASGLVLLMQREPWRRRLASLAPAGRMALSNYLAQTLIGTTLFYGYGLGLYGRVGPAAGVLLSVAVFGLQVAFSRWWVARYRFGPAEWLWRTLTYGRRQPMRLAG